MDTRDLVAGHHALRTGRVSTAGATYLVTTTTRGREPVFRSRGTAEAACRCFLAPTILRDNSLMAWVLMPDHVHWLITFGARDRIESIVNRLKSASARAAKQARGGSGAVWSKAFHNRSIRSEDAAIDAAQYISMNPVRAGLVIIADDYPYSHAARRQRSRAWPAPKEAERVGQSDITAPTLRPRT